VTPKPDFQISDDPAGAACDVLVATGGHVVLTGGSTPRSAYKRAAERRGDWSGVGIWFTDERCVAPDHEHSNFRMIEEALLSRIEGAAVHRMQGELGPQDGAAAYERELAAEGPEAFDLMIVGLGPDVTSARCFRTTTRSASESGAWWVSRHPEWRRWCPASRLPFRW
jgi:6-phosphogluconolactonase